MLAVSLVFGFLMTILFVIVGLIGGWSIREYMLKYQDRPPLHPEFFDEHGNVIPDEIFAVTFSQDFFDSEDLDEDEEEI